MRRLCGLTLSLALAACGGGTPTPATSPRPVVTPPAAATVAATVRPSASPAAATTTATAAAKPPCPAAASGSAAKATITLEKGGAIVLSLNAAKAPLTVANFVAKARACFYDGLVFHRVEPNFVIQGGDPKGNGTGGANTLPTEPNDLPFVIGALGVARGGDPKVSNDAQFFICTGQCRFLDGQYTNFGLVTAGQDVANAVQVGDRIRTIRVE